MYLGPPSIEAGGKDFSMLVTIPTDTLDNPLLENTNVAVKRQFLNGKKSATIKVNNLIYIYFRWPPPDGSFGIHLILGFTG